MKLSRFINSMPNHTFSMTNSEYPDGIFHRTKNRVGPKIYFEESNKFNPKQTIKCYPNQTLYSDGTFLELGSKQTKTLTLNTDLKVNLYKELLTDSSLIQCWKNKASVKMYLSGSNIDTNTAITLNLSGESAVYKDQIATANEYTVSFNVDSQGKLHYASDCPNMSYASTINSSGIKVAKLVIEYYPSTVKGNNIKALDKNTNYALGNPSVELLQKYSYSSIVQNSYCTVCYKYGEASKIMVIGPNGDISITDAPMGQSVSFSVVDNRIFMYVDADVYCNKLWYIDNTTTWTEVTLPLYYKDALGLFTKIYDPSTGDFATGDYSHIIYIYPTSSYWTTLHDTDGGAQVSKCMYSSNGGRTWSTCTMPVKCGKIYRYGSGDNINFIISSTYSSSCILYYSPYFFFGTSDTISLNSVTFNSAYHELCTLQGYLCCFPDTTSTSNSKYYYSSDGKTWTSKSITSGKWGMKVYDNTKVILGYATGTGPLAEQYQTYNFLVITNPTSGASSSTGSETSNPSHPKWYTNTRAEIIDRGYNVKIAQWISKTYISIDGGSFTQASGISAPSGLIRVHGSCFLCYSSKTLYRSINGTAYSSIKTFEQSIDYINIINGLIIIQVGGSSSNCCNKLYVSYNNGSTFEEIILPKAISFYNSIYADNHYVISGTYYIDGVEDRKLACFNYFLHPTISETINNQEEQL